MTTKQHDFSGLLRSEFPDQTLLRMTEEEQRICAIAADLVATCEGECDIEFVASSHKASDQVYEKAFALAILMWKDKDMVCHLTSLRIVSTALYVDSLVCGDRRGFASILPLFQRAEERERQQPS